MLGMLVGAVLISLIHSPYPDLAPLQNVPTLVLVAFAFRLLARWPMSSFSVALLTLFLLLHTLGGRFAYSFVPYDDWLRVLGLPPMSECFGFTRNHYDRLVHFAFGALTVVPIREALIRHLKVRSVSALYIAGEFVFATSALYEIFEWLLTLTMAGPNADAYNGQQGDIWDAQKDMACAALGALASAAMTLLSHSKSNPANVLDQPSGPLRIARHDTKT